MKAEDVRMLKDVAELVLGSTHAGVEVPPEQLLRHIDERAALLAACKRAAAAIAYFVVMGVDLGLHGGVLGAVCEAIAKAEEP